MKVVDRFFSALLMFGAAGHTLGTILFYNWPSEVFVWSLGSSVAAFLLVAINLLRVNRPDDRTLATICALGATAWLCTVMAFGVVQGNLLDPRVLIHGVAAIGLLAMSLRSLEAAQDL